MAVRNDLTVDWEASPRVITVLAPSIEITIQDLHDSCRTLEAEPAAMDDKPLIDSSGLEKLDDTTKVGITATLQNALLAFEARTGPEYIQCSVSGGNLVAVDDVGTYFQTPIYPTAFTQIVVTASSSATLQEQSALQYASYSSVVSVDVTSSNTGAEYPVGTPQFPVNNMIDGHLIAVTTGLNKFRIYTDMDVSGIDLSDGHIFCGMSPYVLLTLDASANLLNCGFENISIQGEVDGVNAAMDCFVLDITNASGVFQQCAFGGTLTMSGDTDMFDCYSRVEGGGYPVFVSGSHNIVARNHKGSFGLSGATAGHLSSIGVYGGRFIAEPSCVGGEVHVRGEPFEIRDNSAAGCTVINETASEKANDLWQLAGLDKDNPMIVTPTARTADDIDLVITGDGVASTTVTRQ